MDKKLIRSAICADLEQSTGMPASLIKDETSLRNDLEMDSLDFMEVVDNLQLTLDVQVEDAASGTVGELVEVFYKALNEYDK